MNEELVISKRVSGASNQLVYWEQQHRKKEKKTKSIQKLLTDTRIVQITLQDGFRLLKIMFISMYSILGWASFCMNYCINAAWHGENQSVALLRCNGSPCCFDSGLQVICIVGSGVSHLPLDKTPRYSMGFRSGEFAGQSSTVTPWSLN